MGLNGYLPEIFLKLYQIYAEPNRRTTPQRGDLVNLQPGYFAYWFDGGACRSQLTGLGNYYEFDDGGKAHSAGPSVVYQEQRYSLYITLKDGTEVTVFSSEFPSTNQWNPTSYTISIGEPANPPLGDPETTKPQLS